MKNWKKTILQSVATLAVVTALIGCGNLTGNSSKKDNATNDKNDKDKVTLLMYQIGDKPKNFDKLMENANKIIGEKINAKVDLQYIGWGDYSKKMAIITSSGENYDIAFAQNYVSNAQKGAYADLTDYYKTIGKKLYDALDPAYIKGNLVDGKIYAVPVSGNVTSQQMISFNSTFLKKYNLDVSNVKSYEDLEPLLQVIKEKENDVVPFAVGKSFIVSDDFDYPISNDYPFAIDLKGDTTKIVNRYEVEHYVNHLRTMHKYYKAGYIPQDAATSDTSYGLDTNTWFAREETQGPADYGDSLLTTVAKKEIVSRPITENFKTTRSTQVANFVISNNSKHKEKAMEFLTLLNTDKDLLNGLVFGPEGENWEKSKTDPTRITLLAGYSDNGHMSAWNTGNSQILYVTDNVTKEQYDKSQEIFKTAKDSAGLGFNFDIKKVKSELTSVSNVMKQYLTTLNTGTGDPDVIIPEMMEKLKAEASYQKVLDEIQKQYDEFLSAKK